MKGAFSWVIWVLLYPVCSCVDAEAPRYAWHNRMTYKSATIMTISNSIDSCSQHADRMCDGCIRDLYTVSCLGCCAYEWNLERMEGIPDMFISISQEYAYSDSFYQEYQRHYAIKEFGLKKFLLCSPSLNMYSSSYDADIANLQFRLGAQKDFIPRTWLPHSIPRVHINMGFNLDTFEIKGDTSDCALCYFKEYWIIGNLSGIQIEDSIYWLQYGFGFGYKLYNEYAELRMSAGMNVNLYTISGVWRQIYGRSEGNYVWWTYGEVSIALCQIENAHLSIDIFFKSEHISGCNNRYNAIIWAHNAIVSLPCITVSVVF